MRSTKKGSITIVASLSITIVSALLMSLLELGRVTEMQKIAKISTDSAMESLFANYNRTLWDEYHLLGVEAGKSALCDQNTRVAYIRDLVEDSLYASGNNSGSLFQSSVQSVDLSGITYLTDQKGRAFEAAISAYMGNNISYEIYDEIKQLSSQIYDLENSDVDVEGQLDEASDLLGIGSQTNPVPAAGSTQTVIRINNPIKEVSKVNADGILALVLKSGTQISGKKIDISDSLLRRDIEQGDGENLEKSWYQGIVTQAYLMKYLSSFQNPIGERALEYEQEYVVAGKSSDEANLKSVVWRIFAIREIANFIYATQDTKMVSEAGSLATLISIASWQPWMKEVIKYGILASWAIAESVLDLRALLDGKKVALYKNATQWTSKLSNLSSLLSGFAEAKECAGGIDYQMYLAIFTFMESTKKRAYRSMDVMEATVRLVEDREDFQMNDVILEAKLEMLYQYQPVFAPLKDSLHTEAYSGYSYRKAGS